MIQPHERLFAEPDEDDPDTINIWLDGEVILGLSWEELNRAPFHSLKTVLEKVALSVF